MFTDVSPVHQEEFISLCIDTYLSRPLFSSGHLSASVFPDLSSHTNEAGRMLSYEPHTQIGKRLSCVFLIILSQRKLRKVSDWQLIPCCSPYGWWTLWPSFIEQLLYPMSWSPECTLAQSRSYPFCRWLLPLWLKWKTCFQICCLWCMIYCSIFPLFLLYKLLNLFLSVPVLWHIANLQLCSPTPALCLVLRIILVSSENNMLFLCQQVPMWRIDVMYVDALLQAFLLSSFVFKEKKLLF